MSPEPADAIGRVRLLQCPQCEYSLEGLTEAGRCPECGFAFDGDTFTLKGIARGLSTTSRLRVVLWIFVAAVGALAGQIFLAIVFMGVVGSIAVAGLLVAWLAMVAYLILSGKRERKGTETFLFSAGGFGACGVLEPGQPLDSRMTSWHEVNAVRIDRIGSTWHRLRIGRTDPPSRALRDIRLDAGVRCDESKAQWIRKAIEGRMGLPPVAGALSARRPADSDAE